VTTQEGGHTRAEENVFPIVNLLTLNCVLPRRQRRGELLGKIFFFVQETFAVCFTDISHVLLPAIIIFIVKPIT